MAQDLLTMEAMLAQKRADIDALDAQLQQSQDDLREWETSKAAVIEARQKELDEVHQELVTGRESLAAHLEALNKEILDKQADAAKVTDQLTAAQVTLQQIRRAADQREEQARREVDAAAEHAAAYASRAGELEQQIAEREQYA